tara:strand:- start:792 stop:1013 length:222 start_codon:yes stop_codon:yes gene_type:complete
MPKDKDSIVHILATKYNLPLKKVKQIVDHQFKFVTQVIKDGKFDTVRLPYFGKWSVNKNRVKYINKLKKKKDE